MSNVHNTLSTAWAETLYSCIVVGNPIRISFIADTNTAAWITSLGQAKNGIKIIWPVEEGYSTGGVLIWAGAMTNFEFGAPDIESRVEGSFTFTPSGIPFVTPGTSP